MNLLLEAREIIRTQPPSLRVAHLRTASNVLAAAYSEMKNDFTRENITFFIAHVNRTILAIENIHEHTSPSPTGGRARAPETGDVAALGGS